MILVCKMMRPRCHFILDSSIDILCTWLLDYDASSVVMLSLRDLSYSVKHMRKLVHFLSATHHFVQYFVNCHVEKTL